MPSRIPLLFGTMTFGHEGMMGVRTSDPKECQKILDTFFQLGYKELDTARLYGDGTTEQVLSQLDLRGGTIDTKVYPVKPGDHQPSTVRQTLLTSLKALNVSRVRVFYLHAPDRTVPFEDTVREVNALYEEGLFEIFGLSNYAAWEVAEIVGICKANKWVQPKIYQVMYNAITREMEDELLPCARKFGMRLVIYNPLAGGFFAGKLTNQDDPGPTGGRFDPTTGFMGNLYRSRYLNQGYIDALEIIKTVAAKHDLRTTEIALRWCQHHSALIETDGVILGASKAAQLEQNCQDSEKGPLPQEVVDALNEACRIVKASGYAPKYWR